MTYSVKEIYYTLQGEGANAGRPAVFLRFSGCNLWTGLERDRGKGPGGCSDWCDTNFVGTDGPGGGKYRTARELTDAVLTHWPQTPLRSKPLIVCTGGEPLLQVDEPLITALHEAGFEVAVETNGTIEPPSGIDWTTVSPKAGSQLRLRRGDELKLVFPQPGAEPEKFEAMDFGQFFLQPMDSQDISENTRLTVEYCLAHPRWRLSLQTHKLLRIP